MNPALICVDWGTSSFRAWLLDDNGDVLDEVSSGNGILAVPQAKFDAALESAVAHWLPDGTDLPVIASGMITSKSGWIETPYLPLALDVATLAAAIVPHRSAAGRRIFFITGAVRNPDAGLPDVMRGEETEIFGHLTATGERDGIFVLPGTHSKWALVQDGRLITFQTCMTGEVFGLLLKQSILGRLVVDGPFRTEAFKRGLQAGRGEGALLARIFSARSLGLMDRLEGGDIADYLSGLLIGDEIAAAPLTEAVPVTIIGRGDLAERYRIGLAEIGTMAVVAAPGMARAGQWEIAKIAGII